MRSGVGSRRELRSWGSSFPDRQDSVLQSHETVGAEESIGETEPMLPALRESFSF